MTADEIRKYNNQYERDEWFWLKEIAAQLADLNANPVAIDRNQTAARIVEVTDGEYNQSQAARLVELVCKNARR